MGTDRFFPRRRFAADGEREPTVRSHIPWVSSPLEEDDHPEVTQDGPNAGSNSATPSRTNGPSDGKPKLPPFKHRHEASTIELFYDLFFVANLATFTNNHEIVDSKCK